MSGIEPWIVPDTSIENATAAQSAALAQAIPLVVREGLSAGGASAEIAGAIAHLLGRRAARTDQALRLIDPATAPEEMLPWLANWYGWGWLFVDPDDPRRRLPLPRAFPPNPSRLRALLLAWPQINRMHGQAEALRLALDVATGLPGINLDIDADRQHLTVRTPALPMDWATWLARLIAHERPAHMTWELLPGSEPSQ